MIIDEPMVDILMATYNGERYLAEQIESIKSQTYSNWRLLISDDCSTDETLRVVEGYSAEDERIKVASKNIRYGGAKENFFALLKFSNSPYIMFCDQDDVWSPTKIEKSLDAMQLLEREFGEGLPLLAFCDMKVVDSRLNVICESFEAFRNFDTERLSLQQLVAQNVAAGCCMMINRSAAMTCAPKCKRGHIEMHDWWLMLIVSAFGHIKYIDEPLSLYRQHGANEVGAARYSPLKTASDIDFVEEQFLIVIDQALAFLDVYGDMLSGKDRESLQRFTAIRSTTNPIRSVALLIKSGCLKKGVRASGQVVASLRIALHEHRRRSEESDIKSYGV